MPASDAGTVAAPTSTGLPTTAAGPSPAPAGPQGYAEAVYAAWARGDLAAASDLLAAEALAVLAARPPEGTDTWVGPSCDGAAGSTYCSWTGATAVLVLRVGNELAAQGGAAVVEARFEPIP